MSAENRLTHTVSKIKEHPPHNADPLQNQIGASWKVFVKTM